MHKLSSIFSQKWLQNFKEFFITSTSTLVFLFLDFFDVVFCIFFNFVDELLEGKGSPCYCSIEKQDEKSVTGIDEESELSETLYKRRNIFREMGFCKNYKRRKELEKVNDNVMRWSDCGCKKCVTWMNNNVGTELKLHVVIKEPDQAILQDFKDSKAENVVFLHGFLSSSLFWTETIFPNFSEDANKNYRLFAVDLLGFGKSPKPNNCLYTLKDHIEMIEKSIELNSLFHIVAHSMGCVIALALAAKYPDSVKSITLIAPPYFRSTEEDASLIVLNRLATRRLWPPMLFGSAFMSWYEHLGRCVCYIICKNHRIWEGILKLLTWNRDLHFMATDMTRHTHHSAWHTMHNVLCGGAKLMDKYFETLKIAKVKINVIQGNKDQVVPLECSNNVKKKVPDAMVNIVANVDHTSVIKGREKDLCKDLEKFWESNQQKGKRGYVCEQW